MNREIKFRVWDDLNKQWMLGYDRPNLGGFSMIGEVMIFGEYKRMLDSFSIKDLDKLQIMQFTGLHDKNGKPIYEGDILKNDVDNKLLAWKVMFKDGCFGIRNIGIDGSENHSEFYAINSPYYFGDRIIIGNIYENPNLIK